MPFKIYFDFFTVPRAIENVVKHTFSGTVSVNNDSLGICRNITNTTVATVSSLSDLESTIQYALMITAIFTAVAAFPSSYIYFADIVIVRKPKETDKVKTRRALLTKMKIIIVGILCAYSLLSTAWMELFPNLLTTFLIAQLNWAQRTGASLTSIWFGAYGLGNLIVAFVHRYVQTTTLIVIAYLVTFATLVT